MTPSEKLERAITLIREAFAEEQKSRDAIVSNVMAAINIAPMARNLELDCAPEPTEVETKVDLDTPPAERKRAPKGTVDQLCSHALLGAHPDGLKPQEISDAAKDEFERMVAISSIRRHLRDSEEISRYVEVDGVWYLGDKHPLFPKAEASELEDAA